MPGTFRNCSVMSPQPPPVAPRPAAAKVTVQSWQQSQGSREVHVSEPINFGNHVRCSSLDSVESNTSTGSSSGSGSSHSKQPITEGEFIPTRTVTKAPSVPCHNPMQFVKVQSPLYKKAEQQIKLVKEVKIAKECLKETAEDWQSNLDNWKSRRRKVSEKVIQRAEEMRQIEQEEKFRQLKEQQRKIKTFSEIIENRSSKRNYSLDFYIGGGDDSGVGGTPEPDEQEGSLDALHSHTRSDTSEGMTSETDSVDSDVHSSEKVTKQPPKVPQKPSSWLSRQISIETSVHRPPSPNDLHHSVINRNFLMSENISSAEPSDVEGHTADTETSEDDTGFCGLVQPRDSGLGSLSSPRLNDTTDSSSDLSQDSGSGLDKGPYDLDREIISHNNGSLSHHHSHPKSPEIFESFNISGEQFHVKIAAEQILDSKDFGFVLQSRKDNVVYVESVMPDGPADLAGLKIEDRILSINNDPTLNCTESSINFLMKQAIFTGHVDLLVHRIDELQDRNFDSKDIKQKNIVRNSAFAQKLAIFNNGTSGLNNSQGTKLQKEDELHKESLVLRRRSAFEKSNDADVYKNRRSSCVSTTNGIKSTRDERRLSLDSKKSASIIIDVTKKKPPPPIPAKPKMKLFKQETVIQVLNDDAEMDVKSANVDSSSPNDDMPSPNGDNNVSPPSSDENMVPLQDTDKTCHHESEVSLSPNGDDKFKFQSGKNALYMDTELLSPEHCKNPSCDPLLDIDLPNEVLDNVKMPVWDFHMTIDESVSPEFMENDVNSDLSLLNNDTYSSPIHDNICIENDCQLNCETSITDIKPQSPEKQEESNISYISTVYFESHPLTNTSESAVDDIESSKKCEESIIGDCEKIIDSYSNKDNDNIIELNNTNCKIDGSGESLSVDKVDQSSAFDKVEEEDVVSASTNSSSDSPDTETVIDNLCTNVSPIPTDDATEVLTTLNLNAQSSIDYDLQSAGQLPENLEAIAEENSFEIQESNCEQFVENIPMSPPPSYGNIDNCTAVGDLKSVERQMEDIQIASPPPCYASENIDFAVDEHTIENIQNLPPSYSEAISVENQAPIAIEEQTTEVIEVPPLYSDNTKESENEEMCENELEESADTLSPLDVIDQIEMKLMQELEQQALDDFTEVGNGELEDEVNRQLLYLSEDADLLVDLDAPRNVIPPSEPPPPPPPESDKSSFQRINSTKRIKKEMWRRRSDFLGLDASEGINIDDLPPPPPGLEELLKSEMEMQREQRLFIEKRLSLVDSEYTSVDTIESDTTKTATSPNIDSECNLDYTSNIPEAEVFDPIAVDDSKNTSWISENDSQFLTSEEPKYENTFFPQETVMAEERKQVENPQHKAKSNIQTLGAAPRAKIVDSTKWITQTEHVPVLKQRSVDPVFQHGSYDRNFWLTQEANQRMEASSVRTAVDRRYSMPVPPTFNMRQPDVTVRTWSDREVQSQTPQRPRSAIWQGHSDSIAQSQSHFIPSDYFDGSNCTWTETRNPEYDDDKTALNVNHLCSCCSKPLSEGSAMGIDALQLYFHIECFKCCICHLQLGNGTCGTDVQVKSSQLFCPKCFTIE